jgi:hypothetical protein
MKMSTTPSTLLLILAGAMLAAPDAWSADACSVAGEAHRLEVPAEWVVRTTDGVASYRNPRATEGVTTAVYRIDARYASEADRVALMQRVAARDRSYERAGGAQELTVSDFTLDRLGSLLRSRYSGEDPVTTRRFVRMTLTGPCLMESFYYEAIGLDAGPFARRADRILGSVRSAAGLAGGTTPDVPPPRLGVPLPSRMPVRLPLPALNLRN